MPQVLVVTHTFPPQGGGGSVRVAKFVKYLPQFGWTPLVLTVENPRPTYCDPDFLSEMPASVAVTRTWSFEPFRWRSLGRQRAQPERSTGDSSAPVRNPLLRSLKTVDHALVDRLFIPDDRVGWFPFALAGARRLRRSPGFEMVFSTSPPHSSHLAAAWIARTARVPLLLDFRDDWMGNPLFLPRNRLRRKIESRMERAVVKSASSIVATTEEVRASLLQRYPRLSDGAVTVIPNGYDPQDFPDEPPEGSGDAFTLTYVGTLATAQRNALPFFEALKRVVARRPQVTNRLKVQLVGYTSYEYREYLRTQGLTGIVALVPPTSHRNSIRHLMRADALLLLITSREGGDRAVPGKIYEYLYARRPILALACPGPVRNLLKGTGGHEVVNPESTEEIESALEKLVTGRGEGRAPSLEGLDLSAYDRKVLAGRLASVLGEAFRKG